MKNRASLVGLIFLSAATLAIRVRGQAPEHPTDNVKHHRYRLIDTGTFGGPTSSLGFEGERDSNDRGVVVSTAETLSPDPFSPSNCFLTECLLSHTVKWRDGVLTDLGALPGGNSGPIWISDNGLISGLSQNGLTDPLTGAPEFRAVLWKDGTIFDLGTFGGNEACPGAVNGRGQMVGAATTAFDDPFSLCVFSLQQSRAFLWENGAKRDLGTLGGPDAIAEFINEHGQVAGISLVDSTVNPATGVPTQHPFLWQDGKMKDLGTIGGTFVVGVNHLNDRGEVVGAMFTQGDQTYHPFLWNGQAMIDLGTLGGTFGAANWVNDAGDAVGFAATQNGAFFAFLWKNGVMTNLGSVDDDPCSVALAINSRGQVVGASEKCDGTFLHAFLWEDGGITDLNAFAPSGSGVKLTAAPTINDRGEIVAQGVLPNGAVHAFVLIPCDGDGQDADGCRDANADQASISRMYADQPVLTPTEIRDHIRALVSHRNWRFPRSTPK